MAQKQRGSGTRKHGRKKKKPSFMRYKASNRTEKRKVRNLMRTNGMTEGEAVLFRERQKKRAVEEKAAAEAEAKASRKRRRWMVMPT